ncbi:thioredoxin domain-containing protein [Candidatus Saccharibacteria bacterium]|nr:thioredoxin domain-containing protein [Candidatus Saccharibacteria bacterium]
MSKRGVILVLASVMAVVGLVMVANNGSEPDYGAHRLSTIRSLAQEVDKIGVDVPDALNPDVVHEVSDMTGNLPEKTIGNLNTAKVVLYEYADYSCSHCAEWSQTVDKLVEKSEGKLAVVYRGYLLPGFKNSVAAASAATAAQMQGCWQAYKDLLFKNQADWVNASGEALQDQLISCFEEASNGQGNVEQFVADMKSEAVARKVAFEYRMGEAVNLTGTPTFRIDGENVEIRELRNIIEEKLNKV